jgi:hypothetical protein
MSCRDGIEIARQARRGEAGRRRACRVVSGRDRDRDRERFYLTSITGVYFLFDGALSRKCFNP